MNQVLSKFKGELLWVLSFPSSPFLDLDFFCFGILSHIRDDIDVLVRNFQAIGYYFS